MISLFFFYRSSRWPLVFLVAAILPACTTVSPEDKQVTTVSVQATAYSSGPKCNGAWANLNAVGGSLKSGEVNSAAADWSRFPLGTKFRVKETGKLYMVDDYGSAMVGKDKVDLFMTNYRDVRRWGVKDVTLEIVEWGCHEESLTVLKPRWRSRHVKVMIKQLEEKLSQPGTRVSAG